MPKLAPALVLALSLAAPALAQQADPDATGDDAETERVRVALGPQVEPVFPGAKRVAVRPLISLDRARGEDPFRYDAPDQSFSIRLFSRDGFAAGPAFALQGRRLPSDVGGLPGVGRTVEAGGFVQEEIGRHFRVRGELRQGIGGHKGLAGSVALDAILARSEKLLVSVGPRLDWADAAYNNAYFGVTPAGAAITGLPVYTPGSGLRSAGVAAAAHASIGGPWGLYGYVKYDRLVDAGSRSPVVRRFGSENQASLGLALSYTFTRWR